MRKFETVPRKHWVADGGTRVRIGVRVRVSWVADGGTREVEFKY